MVLSTVPAVTLTRGEAWSQIYYWGSDDLTGWTGEALFKRRGETLAKATVTCGDDGSVTVALTAEQTTAFPQVGPATLPARCGDWDLVLTSTAGAKYRPFGGPVLLINGA